VGTGPTGETGATGPLGPSAFSWDPVLSSGVRYINGNTIVGLSSTSKLGRAISIDGYSTPF
jgi:hypothetical protein